jgi:tetratricopeptide (TPR) repeat protein
MSTVNWGSLAVQLSSMGLSNAARDAIRYGEQDFRDEQASRQAWAKRVGESSSAETSRQALRGAFELIESGGSAARAVELVQESIRLSEQDYGRAFLLGFAARLAADAVGSNDKAAKARYLRLAVEGFGAAAQINPQDAEALARLAEAQMQSGAFEDGIRNVGKAMLIDPQNAVARPLAELINVILSSVK